MHRQGMGRHLMRRILDYARSRGIRLVEGDVLEHNTAMLGSARSLGFAVARSPDNPSVLRVYRSPQEKSRA